MPSFGSNANTFDAVTRPLMNQNGITVVDTNNGYGYSPMGIALREQVLFGLPNASFSQTPPDPTAVIDDSLNPLPFWSVQTTNSIPVTASYNATTQTWGVLVDPSTAVNGDTCTIRTRSWVTTDNNLAIRQRAYLNLLKNGTYAGANQWNLTLTATYYDATNTGIGTAVIGTAADNATWTSIGGTTTTGGSAISSSASWVEFAITLAATATVTSGVTVTLQSLLLATSQAATGSFVVVDTYLASGTWTRPTGVTNLLGVLAVGGGGGGGAGQVRTDDRVTVGAPQSGNGAASGGSSRWAYISNLYVGDQTSISVGIGTAGVGGTAFSFSKAATVSTKTGSYGGNGGAGGATTFGTYLTVPGGGGGTAVGGGVAGGGTAAGTITSGVYGVVSLASVAGTASEANGINSTASAYTALPFWSLAFVAGSGGGTATGSGGSGTAIGAPGSGGTAGIIASGGGGGRGQMSIAGVTSAVAGGSGGSGGAGGGGGSVARYNNGTTTLAGTAGAGGAAASNSGAGGGGGGGVILWLDTLAQYTASTLSAKSGAGGNGGDGACLVVYVA